MAMESSQVKYKFTLDQATRLDRLDGVGYHEVDVIRASDAVLIDRQNLVLVESHLKAVQSRPS